MAPLARAALKFILGILLFIGLPLLGWGLAYALSFFDHGARTTYVVFMVVLQAAVVSLMPGVGQGGGEGGQPLARQRLAVFVIQVLSISMVVLAPYSDRHELMTISASTWMRIVGLVTLVLGFILMNWAEKTLGEMFSVQVTLQEDHPLVTEGPYRRLRHPRYTGIILFNLGFALLFRSWLGVAVAAALVGILLWRVRDEEALMAQQFGEEWHTYKKRGQRLLPFIY